VRNIHLTPQLVQAVRDAVDILDIAGDHTRLTRRGNRYQGLCPLHKEKTPSFGVDPAQGLFYCFGCGAGGDAIRLHMLTTGDDFPAAIEALAQRYGIPLPVGGGSPREADRRAEQDRRIQAALEAALRFFQQTLHRTRPGREYLERRQIPQELIAAYGLGFAPDEWQGLIDGLGGRIPLDALEAAGLVAKKEGTNRIYDRFRNRLIFPIYTAVGRLVGFGGRTLGDDRAKYINTSETDRFHKGRLLYGLDQAKRTIREEGRALLVEGYFDVLAAVAAGLPGTVASMGTALTPEQAKLLARYADEVVVGYDGDSAGEKAFGRALPALLAEGLAVRRASFGEGEDPDSLRLAAGPEAVRAAVTNAQEALEMEFERLIPPALQRSAHETTRIADAVDPLLQGIKDPMLRHRYERRAAERLGVPVDFFLARRRQRRDPTPGPGPGGGGSGTDPGREGRPSEVRSLEAQILELLLEGAAEIPPPDKLPVPEVFFDPVCRNIFRAFCTLYTGVGTRPAGKDVQEMLGSDGRAIDRAAKILLERTVSPGDADLPALLGELTRRWEKHRGRELKREIDEAERSGNRELMERLVQEKTELSTRHFRS